MALNNTGPISLGGATAGQSIAVELGLSPTAQISLNDSAVRTLAGVSSGAIVMPTNFYGKSNTPTYNLTISANTANYNIKAAAMAAGWSGTTAATINVTINSGVYVYSTSTGAYAFQTGTSIPTGTVMTLVNNGTILGMGGAAGVGGDATTFWTNASRVPGYGQPGAAGGPAMLLQYAISITNNGIISGGGGGAGGGAPGVL